MENGDRANKYFYKSQCYAINKELILLFKMNKKYKYEYSALFNYLQNQKDFH